VQRAIHTHLYPFVVFAVATSRLKLRKFLKEYVRQSNDGEKKNFQARQAYNAALRTKARNKLRVLDQCPRTSRAKLNSCSYVAWTSIQADYSACNKVPFHLLFSNVSVCVISCSSRCPCQRSSREFPTSCEGAGATCRIRMKVTIRVVFRSGKK
jgi:hypothetical protein